MGRSICNLAEEQDFRALTTPRPSGGATSGEGFIATSWQPTKGPWTLSPAGAKSRFERLINTALVNGVTRSFAADDDGDGASKIPQSGRITRAG